jgi:hypothetical protein
MAHVCNLSPLHRSPTPSLDRGPVQRRVRRAFIATDKPVLSTSQIVEWSHILAPAPIGTMRGVLSVASVSATAMRRWLPQGCGKCRLWWPRLIGSRPSQIGRFFIFAEMHD